METSGKALVDHWNWAAEKGLMNRNTALGLRSACSQVLGVLEDWETVDIKTLDLDGTVARFQNLKKKEFKPNVLETYRRRFKQAVSSYLSYLEDPGNWKPRSAERAPRQERNGGRQRQADSSLSSSGHELPSAGLVEYPFPLREGQTVRLILPRDLKRAEVKRLTAFMSTLTVDFDVDDAAK